MVIRKPLAGENLPGAFLLKELNLFCSTLSSDTIEFELRAWELIYTIKDNINFNKIFFNNAVVEKIQTD